jgi:hypothetical protein
MNLCCQAKVTPVCLRTNCFLISFKVLRAGVGGPCLHRPGNWLVRQLKDDSKLVYKAGFIREKDKATAKVLQWSWKPVVLGQL